MEGSNEFCNDGRFKILDLIGKGGFSDVHLGVDTKTSTDVAIKIENRINRRHLVNEAEMYHKLRGKNCSFVPNIFYYGVELLRGEGVQILVMEKLGASLEDIFKEHGHFSVAAVQKLSVQLISCLQSLHELKIIHRDVKPGNFLMGLDEKADTVHVVDFGLSTSYWNESTNSHYEFEQNCSRKGTYLFMSINTQLKYRPSRRDDLESLGYMLVYLAKKSLPWLGLKESESSTKMEMVLSKKRAATSDFICQGLPRGFAEYIDYCRSLRFSEEPDYCYLKKLFQS